MFINIITPCSRPENLQVISESINIPNENYRWIVVFDFDELPDENLIPKNCEVHLHRNSESSAGHAQRNFALELISDGHIYCNDDDTTLHPELWDNIKDLDNDFISFYQSWKDGNIRITSENIYVNNVDSHNFIIHHSILGETRYNISLYIADGYFATECREKSINPIHIPKVLSVYNSLR